MSKDSAGAKDDLRHMANVMKSYGIANADKIYTAEALRVIVNQITKKEYAGKWNDEKKRVVIKIANERSALLEEHSRVRDELKRAQEYEKVKRLPLEVQVGILKRSEAEIREDKNLPTALSLKIKARVIEGKIASNSEETAYFLEHDVEMSPAKKSARAEAIKVYASEFADALGNGPASAINFLWRGTDGIAKDKKHHPYYENYLRNRSNEIKKVLDKRVGANFADRIAYLERLRSELGLSSDLIDKIASNQIGEYLDKAIKEEKEAEAAQSKAFTEGMAGNEKATLDAVTKYSAQDGDLWKWRLLQIALLVTPLGPLSAFGFLNPLGHVLGSVFTSSLPIVERIANLGTEEVMGWLGYLTDPWLPALTEWTLENVPVVNTVFDAAEVIFNNDIANEACALAGTGLSSVVASSAASVFLAGFYTKWHVKREIDNVFNRSEGFEKCEKEMKNKVQSLLSTYGQRGDSLKASVKTLVESSFSSLEQAYFDSKIAEFAFADASFLGDKTSALATHKHLEENPKEKEEMLNKIAAEKSLTVTDIKKFFKREFVFEIAKQANLTKSLTIETASEEQIADLRAKLIDSRVEQMLKEAQSPGSDLARVKANPLIAGRHNLPAAAA